MFNPISASKEVNCKLSRTSVNVKNDNATVSSEIKSSEKKGRKKKRKSSRIYVQKI